MNKGIPICIDFGYCNPTCFQKIDPKVQKLMFFYL